MRGRRRHLCGCLAAELVDRWLQTSLSNPAYFVTWPLLTAVLNAESLTAAELSWQQTTAILAPASAVLVILCHSCWYLTRATPIRGASVTRLILSHGAAAAVVFLLWTLSFEAIIPILERAFGWHGPGELMASQMPLLSAVGLLCYLFTAAYHYLLIALVSAREAERRAEQLEGDPRGVSRAIFGCQTSGGGGPSRCWPSH